MVRTRSRWGIALAVLSLALAACGRGDEPRKITESRSVMRPPHIPGVEPTSAERFWYRPRPSPPAASPADPSRFAWDAPEGWARRPDRAMRIVTFSPAGDERAECYVSVLAGRAGGEAANINRWRAQMGLPPLSDAEIRALPTTTLLGRPARLVEVAGTFEGMSGGSREGYLLLGAVLEGAAESLFVKMTGPESVLRAERENFIRFCESLR